MTGTTMERPAVRRRRDGVAIGLTVWGVLVFAFLFLPILVMLVYSFNTGRLLATWQGFGFDAYANAWANPVIRASVVTSLEAAVGAALVSTLLGTLGGLALARAARRAPWVLWATLLLTITLFTPEIVDAISMLPWFVSLGTDFGIGVFSNGMVRLVVSHAVLSVAVVTFIVRARMQGMDESLEEAAADLYAPPLRRFWQITLPVASPAIWAGALMSGARRDALAGVYLQLAARRAPAGDRRGLCGDVRAHASGARGRRPGAAQERSLHGGHGEDAGERVTA